MAYGIDNNGKNIMLDNAWGTGASSGVYAAPLTGAAPTSAADAITKEAAYNTSDVTLGKRQQVNWAAAANGAKALAANPQFAVNGSQTITGVAYWKVSSGGSATDYMGSQALQTPEPFGSPGLYTLTAQQITI